MCIVYAFIFTYTYVVTKCAEETAQGIRRLAWMPWQSKPVPKTPVASSNALATHIYTYILLAAVASQTGAAQKAKSLKTSLAAYVGLVHHASAGVEQTLPVDILLYVCVYIYI